MSAQKASTIENDNVYGNEDYLRLGGESATVTVNTVPSVPTSAGSQYDMSCLHIPDTCDGVPVSSGIHESQNQIKDESDVSVYFNCSHSEQSSLSPIDTIYN